MGGIYAREEGLPESVWKAIYYQYLPIGVEADAPPTRAQLGAAAVTWAAVSLADKLDSLVGLLLAGERATGSRDPFGLRRSAHGVMRILMDLPELTNLDIEIPLEQLLAATYTVYGITPADVPYPEFLYERFMSALVQRGARVEIVGAIQNSRIEGWKRSPLQAWRIATSLGGMRRSEEFAGLAALFKRVKNIAKELPPGHEGLDRSVLTEPAELALLAALDSRQPRIAAGLESADYRSVLTEIAGLREPVARFFDQVFVMVDDPRLRTARLALMAQLRDLILQIADISYIVPQSE
jgi:glycyl-tRNA synthetase beta chain